MARSRASGSTRLPPVHLLQVFDAAARRLSFKAAAEELFVTPSAVSHQVRALETHLGVPLFLRLNRRIRLTPEGGSYAAFVGEAFDALRAGHRAFSERSTGSRLRLSAAAFFASEFILPYLGDFQARFPDIELTIETGVRLSRIEDGEADVGIRFGDGNWPGLRAEHLFHCGLTPVCNAALATRLRASGPAGLVDVPLIQPQPTPQAWELWSRHVGIDLPAPRKGVRLDSYWAVLQAAESGVGVAPGLKPIVDPWLAQGRVVQPFDDVLPLDQGYWMVVRKADARRPELRRFRAWLFTVFRRAGLIKDE